MIRFFDFAFSLIALIVFSPIFFGVIIILKLTGEGEIWYTQKRKGEGGKDINLLKFATMLKDSEKIGSKTITLKDDFRVLPFGKFLRATKINELPQLINVLLGEMSLIGPRPQEERCFRAFPRKYQKSILLVKPGLSGIGSIIFRAEDAMTSLSPDYDNVYDNVIMPYKGRVEDWYVKKRNLWLYFKLIFLTIYVIIYPRHSISAPNHFKGMPKPSKEMEELLIKAYESK